MRRSTFSTTTMASSTTMPIASTRPNSDSVLMEKPNASSTRERADYRNRYGNERNDRRAPRLQEQDDDEHDQHDRFEQRVEHRVDRLLHELRRVVDDFVLHAIREILAQLFHRRVDVFRRAAGHSSRGDWKKGSATAF